MGIIEKSELIRIDYWGEADTMGVDRSLSLFLMDSLILNFMESLA